MPPPLSSAAPVLESLDGVPFQRVRDWRSCILRSEDEQRAYLESAARVKPYLDPGLVRDPAIYAIFLRRLHECGILLCCLPSRITARSTHFDLNNANVHEILQ